MPGAVAKPSVGRKKQLRGTWWKGGPLPGPPFRCWGLEGVPFHFGRLGTRKRFGLDTPPPQSPGVGVGGVVRRPLGAESGVRGPRSGSASGEVGLGPVQRGEGQALRCPRLRGPYACVQKRPASSRCTRGGGEGEAGRRKPTTKLASPRARLDLNGRSPRPRSAEATRKNAVCWQGAARRRSAAGTGHGRPGGLRARAELGSDRTSRLVRIAPAAGPGGAAHLAPSAGALHLEGTAGELFLRGAPLRDAYPAGACSSAKGWSQPRAPPAAHIWKESEGGWWGGGWKDAGRQGMWGAGGTGEGRGPLCLGPGLSVCPCLSTSAPSS